MSNKLQRILSLVLVFVMFLTSMPTNALATGIADGVDVVYTDSANGDPVDTTSADGAPTAEGESGAENTVVAKLNGNEYTSLKAAFEAAVVSGGTIVLQEDVQERVQLSVSGTELEKVQKVTLHLNGHTWDCGNGSRLNAMDLTIEGSGVIGTASKDREADGSSVDVLFFGGHKKLPSTLTIDGDIVFNAELRVNNMAPSDAEIDLLLKTKSAEKVNVTKAFIKGGDFKAAVHVQAEAYLTITNGSVPKIVAEDGAIVDDQTKKASTVTTGKIAAVGNAILTKSGITTMITALSGDEVKFKVTAPYGLDPDKVMVLNPDAESAVALSEEGVKNTKDGSTSKTFIYNFANTDATVDYYKIDWTNDGTFDVLVEVKRELEVKASITFDAFGSKTTIEYPGYSGNPATESLQGLVDWYFLCNDANEKAMEHVGISYCDDTPVLTVYAKDLGHDTAVLGNTDSQGKYTPSETMTWTVKAAEGVTLDTDNFIMASGYTLTENADGTWTAATPAAVNHVVDLSVGSYTIAAEGEWIVLPYTGSNTLTIKADATVELQGVNITAEGQSAISIENCNVTLNVTADSTVKGGKGGAGVYVAEGAAVTIKGGKLTAIGNGGKDTADSGAAGIGGTYANGNSGAITIDRATVVAMGYGVHGSGIGSGSGKVVDEIKIINGADVIAYGGYYADGAGTTLQSAYGKSDPEGGAAIGGGGKTVSTIADITIENSKVTAYGGSKAAGIGANFWSSVGTITISGNSDVTAQGGSSSAGIGTSREGDNGVNANIVISGGKVTATGGAYGAGIGGGYNNDSLGNGKETSGLPAKTVTISGGTVTATGGEGGAGIGGGYKGDNIDINITGGTVTAQAGALVSGKTIDNGGEACAIGSGANGSGKFENSPAVEIGNAATVNVTTEYGGKPAIEGMDDKVAGALENVTVTVNGAPIEGTITEDMVWSEENGDVVGSVTISGNVTITVIGTVPVTGTIRLSPDSISNVTFKGEAYNDNDAKLIRSGDFTGQMFYAEGVSGNFQNLTFNNITLDGGAVWTGDVDKTLNRGKTNEGIKATGSVLYLVYANADLNNSTLQNHDDASGEKANAVFLRYYSTIDFNNSVVRNNNSVSSYYRGGVITVRQGGTVKTNNAEVYGNSGVKGGFYGTSSTGSYGGVVEVYNSKFHNNYANNGAVFDMQCNSNRGYLLIDGCEFYQNASNRGLIYEHSYSRPVTIKDSYFHDNECAVWDCHADPVLNISGKIVVEEDADYNKYLFETPFVLGGALADGSSIAISEASLTKLGGWVVSDSADYAVTEADLAKFALPEGYSFYKLDVNGDGVCDYVAVNAESVVTVKVTVYDNFPGSEATEVQDIPNDVKCLPALNFAHEGFVFSGWMTTAVGTEVEKSQEFTEATELYAKWAVKAPVVKLSRVDPEGNTIQATVTNASENITYTYQWYKEDEAIEGANEATYTITETAKYKCEVTATVEGFEPVTGSASNTVTYKVIPVAQVGDVVYESLKEAIDAAQNDDVITLLADIAEDVTVTQQPNVVITIDGNYWTYTGTITVDGKSEAYETAGLTIQNVIFDATGISKEASINLGVKGDTNTRYTSNVTVSDCNFTDDDQSVAAIKSYTGGDKNLTVTGCTATGMHSLLQVKTISGVTVSGCAINNCKNGISLSASSGVTIDNCYIDVTGYGVRADGIATNDNICTASVTVTKSTITANLPIVVRKVTANGFQLNADGNTLNTLSEDGYQIIFTNGDDGTYEEPTGTYKLTIGENDAYVVYPDAAYVAKVGEQGYMTLAEAIAAANAIEGGATVTLLKDVELGETLTISGNVTITGDKTITRAATYAGTLFTVNAGATLTLDGGLVIDGGNDWTFDEEGFMAALYDSSSSSSGLAFVTSEEGAPCATAPMININGNLVAKNVTVKNHLSTSGSNDGSRAVFKLNNGATMTMEGAKVTHCATGDASTVWGLNGGSYLYINEGTEIFGNYGGRNGAMARVNNSIVIMNGGSINHNYSVNANGSIFMMYGSGNKFIMNGGEICTNYATKGSNGRTSAIYLHSAGVMEMNGGSICHNVGSGYAGIDSNQSSGSYLTITNGSVVNNVSTGGNVYHDINWPSANTGASISGGTFTQDVSKWLAPNTGLSYDEETGRYSVVNEGLYKLYLTDPNTHEPATIPYIEGNDLAELVATGKLFYAGYYDMELEVLYSVKIDKTVVIDYPMSVNLNGKTLTAAAGMDPMFRIESDVVFTGSGKVDARNGEAYVFIIGKPDGTEGKLTINGDATFYGETTVASVTKGTLTINGGKFAVNPYEGSYDYLLNCIDANYKDGSAKIEVTGGTFYKFNPANNAAEGAETSFVPEGYIAEELTEGYFTVRKANYVAQVGDVKYEDLNEAITAAVATEEKVVTVLKTIVLTEDGTLDLQGVRLNASANIQNAPVFRVLAKVIVVNGGIVDGRGPVEGEGGINCYAFIVGNDETAGELTITGGTYRGVTSAISITNGVVNISGGTFQAGHDNEGTDYGATYVLNCVDAAYKNGTAKFNITGGKFIGFNPENNAAEGEGTNFLQDGYKASDYNGDNKWTVAQANVEIDGKYFTTIYDALNFVQPRETATIKILNDILITADQRMFTNYSIVINAEYITLDLNGKTITFDYEGSTSTCYAAIAIYNQGTLKVIDTGDGTGTLYNKTQIQGNEGPRIIWVTSAGNATIEGGNFISEQAHTMFYTSNSNKDVPTTLYINGGYFEHTVPTENEKYRYFNQQNGYQEQIIELSGGIFAHDPSDGEMRYAEGFKIEQNEDGTWSVVPKNYIAQVGETKYESLQEAINACTNGETVKLIADITYDADDVVYAHGGATGFGNYDQYNPSIIYVGGTKGATAADNQPSNVNVKIDLNGHTITSNADAYLFLFMDNCKVTMLDSVGGGKVVNNSTNYPAIWAVGTDTLVTIQSGTYQTASATGLIHATHAGDVVINGGYFMTTADDASLLLMINSQEYNNPNYFLSGVATLTVYRGTFVGFNPSKVGDDYGASSIADIKFVDGCALGYVPVLNEEGNAYTVEPWNYEIYTWDDLIRLDKIVESGNMLEGVTVKLMNDIDLYKMGEDGEPVTFNPIGANNKYFKGTFDGQGHTIYNLYQSGWALGYDWDNYGTIGLFSYLWNATVKDLTISGAECFVEGGCVGGIAGSAWGDCTFENITIKNSTIATYNNRAGGIVGYTGGSGTFTFKKVTVDSGTVIAGLWGSFDSSLGGVMGQLQSESTVVFDDVKVACRIDAYNDVTASYKWYAYRMCGMLIGRIAVDGDNKPILNNVKFEGPVYVNFGDWANYTYIWDDSLSRGCQRVEAGYAYGGIDVSQYPDADITLLPFTSLFGGQQYGSYGQAEHDMVNVNHPYEAKIDETEYWLLSDAIEAAKDGDTVVVQRDIAVYDEITVAGKQITLDLNGKTVTGVRVYPVIRVQDGANVTVENGTITNDDYVFVLGAADGSSAGYLTIESGSYTGETTVASVTKGELTITGGTFTATDSGYGSTYLLNCIDANYKDGSAKIVVSGGTFVGFNPENNAAEGDGTNFCAEGYIAVDNGDGTYTVKLLKLEIWTKEDLEYFRDLANAGVSFSGKTVKLMADIDLNGETWTPINKFGGTFAGGDHTISNFHIDATAGHAGFFNVLEWATVENLTLADATATVGNYRFGTLARSINQTNIDNVTVKNVQVTTNGPDAFVAGLFCQGTVNSNMEVNNCTVENLTVNAEKGAMLIAGITAFVQKNGTEAEGTNILENLHVKDFKVVVNDTDAFTAVGGLVGQTQTVWQNPRFNNCSVSGLDVTASGKVDVGGFMCYPGSWTYAEDCTVAGTINVTGVTSASNYAGGFFGNYGWGDNVGKGDHKVTSCTANVTIVTKVATAGGFVGSGINTEGRNKNITLTECKAKGTVTCVEGGTAIIGGFAGNTDRGIYIDCTAAQEPFIGNVSDETKLVNSNSYVAKVDDSLYATFDAALDAAKKSESKAVVLLAPVVLSTSKEFDLADVNVTGDVFPMFRIVNGANVTMNGGSVANGDYVFVLGASDGSSAGYLTIESGSYTGETTVASVTKGELTITGGTFTATDGGYGSTYLLNCIDANYKDGSAKIEVYGGTFYGFNPENNAAEGANTNFCAEGYFANNNNDGTWTVKKQITITVTMDDLTYVIGDEAPEFTYKVEGVVEGDEIMLVVEIDEFDFTTIKADTYDITATGYVFMRDDYKVVVVPGKLTVKQPVEVKFDDQEIVLGNELPKFTYTTNFAEVSEDGEMLVVETPVVEVNGAGEYEITANAYVFMSDKYVVTVVPGTLTVEAAVAKIGDTYYANLVDAINAAQNGETIEVVKSHTIDGSKTVVTSNFGYDTIVAIDGKAITIDFGGNTVSMTPSAENVDGGIEKTIESVIFIENGGSLTLKGEGGLTVNIGSTALYALIYNCGSTLVIEGGNYNVAETITAGSLLYADGSHNSIVSGGNFTLGNASADASSTKPWIFNTEGKNKTFFTVTGGTYNQNLLMNYGTAKDCEVAIPETKALKNNGNGTWTVVTAIKVNVTFADQTMVYGNALPEFTYTTNFIEVAEDGMMLSVEEPAVEVTGAGEYEITAKASVLMNNGQYVVTVTPGTLTVVGAVASVNGTNYATLQEAVEAAQAGETITFLADIEENVTVDKNVTIDGAEKNYTGTMSVSKGKTVTVQNVNFVKGCIDKAKGTSGTLTVKNCDFDGVDRSINYAVTMRGGNTVTLEGCTVKDYDYGMLYVPSAVTNVNVKETTVEGVNYGVHVAYGSKINLDNVTMADVAYGIMTQNYGAKIITIKNSTITGTNPIYVWERNTTVVDTFNFEGTNTVSVLPESTQAKLVLTTEDATLAAPEGATVTTDIANHAVVYEGDVYKVVKVLIELKAIEISVESEQVLRLKMTIADEYLTDEAARVVLTKDGRELTTKTYTAAQIKAMTPDKNGRYVFERGLAAGEMTADVTITFYDGDGNVVNVKDYADGEVKTSITRTAVDWAELALERGNDKQKALAKAMVTYGGYAQKFFGVAAENPAYDILDSQMNLSSVTTDNIKDIVVGDSTGMGITYDTQQAGLDSRVNLRTYFKLEAGVDIEDFTFTVQKPGAKTVEIEPQKTGNRWYIEVEDIVVAYWDDDCVITVTNEAGDSFTITGSVLAYAKRGIQGTMNEDQRNMFKAMIKYNEAADDLFFGN